MNAKSSAAKVIHDPENDTLYIRLGDSAIIESEEIEPGVVVDYDAENRIVGVEILQVSARLLRPAKVS